MNTDSETRDPLTHSIIGAAFEVHRQLGAGFLESVYGRALTIELQSRGHTVQSEAPLTVHYKSQAVGSFKADLLVDDEVIVELKAGSGIAPEHEAQLMNYLRASELKLGLLIHFGQRVDVKRRRM
jgi:GxxExxY protein